MDFGYSPKVEELRTRVGNFIEEHVVPRLGQYRQEAVAGQPVEFMTDLRALAKEEGLWNMFLPHLKDDEPGTRLSNLEYAPLAEIMGRYHFASEVFNCNAPDTGNMELLHMFATPEQRKQWLEPMLNGEFHSAFAMTEPDVASSDATNIQTLIQREGNEYVINGRKWFISNAARHNCELFILMGKTDTAAESHKQQSMVLIPANTPGIDIERNIPVMNHISYEGHCEIVFRNVRIPVSNLLGEEGSGFALSQARLGPGRIHHCMRSIGATELALDLMMARSKERKTFGKFLHQHGAVSDWIARSRMEIDQARLMVLKAAWMIDNVGVKAARKEISMIKAIVPKVMGDVSDRAMQTFGAMGISPDTPLADIWTGARALRYADGPDEVHLRSIARMELKASEGRLQSVLNVLSIPERR